MKKIALVLVSILAACGDNHARPDAGATGDGPAADAPPAAEKAFVVAGDFQPGHPGASAAIDIKTLAVTRSAAPAGAVGDDPIVRKLGGELFVVNRADGNNVTILDAQTHALVEQIGTGAGSNPQDVAIKGNKLYVPVLGGAGVAVLTRGSTQIATIDLSQFDPDGKPDCMSATLVGNDLYVACELLDQNFSPRGPGKIAVIDTATDTLKTSFDMMNKNPFGNFEQTPTGDLVIPTIDFSNNAGCAEKITTGTSPASGGCVVTNAQINGSISRIAFVTSPIPMMFMAVSAFDFLHANLQVFDMQTKSLWSMPISADTEKIGDVAACPDGTLVVSDGTMATGGIRIYVNAMEGTTKALDIGLTPTSAHGIVCY